MYQSRTYDHLDCIDNITLTQREIDVLACLLSGKSAKSIGSLLSVAQKTVEAHTRNIMVKLNCHSKEDIIDFVERSPKLPLVKRHYFNLLMYSDFLHKIHHIANLTDKSFTLYVFEEEPKKKSAFSFIKEMSTCLCTAGIKFSVKKIKTHISLSQYVDKIEAEYEAILYISSDNKALNKQDIVSLTKGASGKFGSIIYFSPEPLSSDPIKSEEEVGHVIYLSEKEPPYLLGFYILKIFLPDIKPIIDSFKNQWSHVFDTTPAVFVRQNSSATQKLEREKFSSEWVYQPKFLILLSLSIGSIFYCGWQLAPFSPTSVIRSDLLLPTETHTLQRPKIIKEIEKKFKEKPGTQTVLLIGIGGAGKTTIARQYARTQKSGVVWEFNAENQSNLIKSFEQLAYNISRNSAEKEILESIKKVVNVQERIKQLLHFTKHRLKNQNRPWCLIFDNVENFADIQTFFPLDSATWGSGKILITTRNNHLKHDPCIIPENALHVEKLNEREQLELFTKIINEEKASVLNNKDKKEIINFLSYIPPFPLDISVAGNYIKNTKIPYQEYLKRIHSNDLTFEDNQIDFLRETRDDVKTRYNIISSTLQKLIEKSPDVIDLLLLISVIDAQNIPKDLLLKIKNEATVELFIHFMNQHSLLSYENSPAQITFFIHRSTQENIIKYLIHLLGNEEIKKRLSTVIELIESYSDVIVKNEDIPGLQNTAGHLLMLLKYESLLMNENSKGIAMSLLGQLYFELNDFLKAKTYLESGLLSPQKGCSLKTSARLARTQAYLGAVLRQLGDYKKAQQLLEDSLERYTKIPSHRDEGTAWALLQLGNVYTYVGYYQKAEEVLEKSIFLYKKLYGDNHPNIALGLTYLGDKHRFTGNDEEGKPCFEKSYAIYMKLYGPNHSRTALASVRLGISYKRLGYYFKAENLLRTSYQTYKEKFPGYYDSRSWSAARLGDMYRILGRYKKAEKLLKEAVTIATQYHGRDHVQTAWWSSYLAKLYIDLENYTEAQRLLEYNLSIYKKCFAKNPVKIGWVMRYLANTYKFSKLFDKAEELFWASLKIYQKHYGENSKEVAHILRDTGHFYSLKGDYEKAESLINQALTTFQKIKNPEAYKCLEYLGDLYLIKSKSMTNQKNSEYCQKLKTQSTNYFKEAFEIAKANFPKESAHIERISKKLKGLL